MGSNKADPDLPLTYWRAALAEAERMGDLGISTEHLLIVVAAARPLIRRSLSADALRAEAGRCVARPPADARLTERRMIHLSSTAMAVVRRINRRTERGDVTPEAILAALVGGPSDEPNEATVVLESLGVSIDDIRDELSEFLLGPH